jgi:glycogen operon protein
VRGLILDALRYWVMEMHVDGFRFDLASVLGRDRDGQVRADTPLLERIAEDPILRDAKPIAEAWDAAGAYQVGNFSERRWAEWNGCFRGDVRRFWRGDEGLSDTSACRAFTTCLAITSASANQASHLTLIPRAVGFDV